MNLKFALAGVVILLLGGGAYHQIFDGALPEKSNYDLDLEALRRLAADDPENLPTEMRMEVLAKTPAPAFALRAGGGFDTVNMVRATFQIVGSGGYAVLEAGMDRALAEAHGQGDEFNETVWRNIQILLSGADVILATHEHPDHIGGIVRHHSPSDLANSIFLTREQFAALPTFAGDGRTPTALQSHQPVDLTAPMRIAPGIVMLRAEGHTPGSVMFFVTLGNGDEFLFVGDIAYTGANITRGVDRPRFVRHLMVSKENREKVVNQLRTLHALSHAHPELNIVPSHGELALNMLIADGSIKSGFVMPAP